MKYVESWWVEELPNGIYHLIINTTEKWIDYHAYNDTEFLIGEDSCNLKELKSKIFILPEFLPKTEWFYIRTSTQNKDQISFYWIPYDKDYIKNRKIILQSVERDNELNYEN